MSRLIVIACLILCLGVASCGETAPADRCTFSGAADTLVEPQRHTPRWAFEPWISKDISSTDDTYAFVEGFAARDIPVGAVVLDSPWENQYNTFVPHPVRYHDFAKLVSDLHARNIRVVLWVTQMVNTSSLDFESGGDTYDGPSPNYQQGLDCNFYVNQADTYLWWKGTGSGLDFENGRATAWWHRQQDPLYDIGIDGWKLDFGESYISGANVETAAGLVTHQHYSESYYRDYLAYGVQKRGRDFLTMVRGWDASYFFDGRFFARPEHAPVAWAGDNRRDYVGLADALDTMFRTARAGYVAMGSDVGGYLDFDDKTHIDVPASQETFARWTGVAALTPLMQLHGRANLTPWTIPERPDETVELYRAWAKLHHQLVPFFYSLAEQQHGGGAHVLEPVGSEQQWPGDYRFTVGEAFLVAPLLDASGRRDVALPANARWYDWWTPAAAALDGGQTLIGYDASDRRRIPLFVRQGAIVPTAAALWVWPAPAQSTFAIVDDDTTLTQVTAKDSGSAYLVTLSRVRPPTALKVHADRAVTGATLDGAPIAFVADPTTASVTLDLPAGESARQLTLTAP